MRNVLILLLTVFLSVGILVTDVQAKRFGGGKSFGTQRTIGMQPHGPAAQAAKPQTAAATKPGANRWLGPLAGLAAGGFLAYLLMGHGLGAGLLSWLAIAVVLWLVWNIVRRMLRPATSPATPFHSFQQTSAREVSAPLPMSSDGHTYEAHAEVPIYPAGFDAADFLRNAKVQFLRLQAAYDSKNLNDLRDFNTPDVFAELQMQIQERGDQPNQTEVLHLDAKVLEALDDGQALIVSVEFSGLIRENPQESAAQFNEIWHFQKDHHVQKWLVAGIQQGNSSAQD